MKKIICKIFGHSLNVSNVELLMMEITGKVKKDIYCKVCGIKIKTVKTKI